jgi:VWFA-related protein
VKGKKSILILASGLDTFSRTDFDEIRDQVRQLDVSIYAVGVAEQLFMAEEMRGGVSSIGSLTYHQAQGRLRSFAELTGGRAWFPRFEGEIPGIMGDIAARLRSQYSLAYVPSNKIMDGKYRKIKVELLAADGSPLTSIVDRNGKKRKVVVYARQGYLAAKSDLND